MAEFGKQLKSVMSSIRVADRITNLIRSDERSKGQARTDVYRVAVAIAPPSASGGEAVPIGRDYKLSLVEKKSSEHVHFVIRAWPVIKQIVLFIRGVVPKLDVPPLPVEAAGSAPALVAEDRRKYIQTYVNAALLNAAVSNLKEFQDLIGLAEFTSVHAHDAPPSLNSTASRVQLENSSFTKMPSVDNVSSASFSSPSTTATLPQKRPATTGLTGGDASSSFHRQLEECFRVMDVGGAGYLTPDDMKDFLDIMMEHTQRSKSVVARIVKTADAVAATDFATMILKAAQESSPAAHSNQTVEKWITEYHSSVFTEVYSAIGGSSSIRSGEAEHREYDKAELRTLQFILRVSGVRIITEAEIDREEGLSLPVTVDDFCRLMSLVVAIIPFDDVIRALEVSSRGDHAKLLNLVSKNATNATNAAKKQALRNLQDAIAELGGGARRLGKCGNCEAAEQRIRAMKLQMSALEEENNKLKQGAVELEDQLTVRHHDFADAASQATTIVALEQEVAALKEALSMWEAKSMALEDRVKELESVDAPHTTAEAAPTIVYEVAPTVFNGTSASILDLPGALTIPAFTGSGQRSATELQLDVFFTGNKGVECLACRGSSGERFLGLRFENGVIHCLNANAVSLTLPRERWVRLSLKLDIISRTFHLKINGLTMWSNVPLKNCDDDMSRFYFDLLDIYPRHEVLYCYANIQFLVHS
ncbi:Hypothetical protein, putative [Bodo saltans]|uniref:EF-hand domain-containing protein n=1 Tax=Bodo saltans TaxID=75058 RepID=A0A0S4JTQ9_BODSA|nr:Hypothetical protein, putative [Bodo saltans]|eukprot:CUG92505.1 Hypothetical protein, putative [Bodo saltans]